MPCLKRSKQHCLGVNRKCSMKPLTWLSFSLGLRIRMLIVAHWSCNYIKSDVINTCYDCSIFSLLHWNDVAPNDKRRAQGPFYGYNTYQGLTPTSHAHSIAEVWGIGWRAFDPCLPQLSQASTWQMVEGGREGGGSNKLKMALHANKVLHLRIKINTGEYPIIVLYHVD